MLHAAGLLHLSAFLGEAADCSIHYVYGADIPPFLKTLNLPITIPDETHRVLAINLMLPPSTLAAMISHLDKHFSQGAAINLNDVGRLYAEPLPHHTVAFYCLMPVSALLTDAVEQKHRRRNRNRARGRNNQRRNKLEAAMQASVERGDFEQAARLRDKLAGQATGGERPTGEPG